MINKQIPFFSNTSDNTHCFQAALRMVLKYFYPREEYSYKKLDYITGKIKDLWTWPMTGLIWLKQKGLKIKVIESFNYQRFINEGEDYLVKEWGNEVTAEQVKHSDIEKERKITKKFLRVIPVEKRIPDLDDIKKLLHEGYLLICNVNSRILDKRSGYIGHFIVVININNSHTYLHDPGLPPMKNRLVDLSLFEKAWAYPTKKAKNIIAIKK